MCAAARPLLIRHGFKPKAAIPDLPRLPPQVMCATYEPPRDPPDGKHVDMKPLPTNTRHACAIAMEKAASEEPWFGIEQACALRGCAVVPPGWAVRCRSHCCRANRGLRGGV